MDPPGGRNPEPLVRDYLRGQNLEQIGRIDEAIVLYEQAVAAGFDSAGPYDRLIAIYRGRRAHAEVQRVSGAALANVRTFADKRAFYEDVLQEAGAAAATEPDPAGPEF